MNSLTNRQKLIWVEDELHPGLPINNVISGITINGGIDVTLLKQAFAVICQRFTVLRLHVYRKDNGQHYFEDIGQGVPIDIIDISRAEDVDAAKKMALSDFSEVCFTDGQYLYRICLLVLADDQVSLYINQHHSVTDGFSCRLIFQQLSMIYTALAQGNSVTDIALEADNFFDFLISQESYTTSSKYDESEQFWQEHYEQPVEPVQFYGQTTFYKTAKTSRVSQVLSNETMALFDSHSLDCSPAIIFTAATFSFLRLVTGNSDLSVGVPLHNREKVFSQVAGLVMDICPNRIAIDSEDSFTGLLEKVNTEIDAVRPYRGHGLSAKLSGYEVIMNFHGQDLYDFAGIPCVYHLTTPLNILDDIQNDEPSSRWSGRESLAIQVHQGEDGRYCLSFDFNDGVWVEPVFRELAVEHFELILTALLSTPERKLSEIDILTSFEKANFVKNEGSAYARGEQVPPVITLFKENAVLMPGKIAVEFEEQSLTYSELEVQVDVLVAQLLSLGVERGRLVGVCLDRSLDMLVALLAVMQSGGAYVPIDPKQPADRIALILEDANPSVLLTETALKTKLGDQSGKPIICLDNNLYEAQAGHVPVHSVTNEDLAYVIFTSGSTGRPKGVEVKHHGLTTFLRAMANEPGMSSQDKVLSVTTISFDIAGLELFLPLIVGGSVRIVPYQITINGELLRKEIERDDITVFQATPASYRMLIASKWEGKNKIKLLCGGEAMPHELAQQLTRRCESLWNMYGPTETTIWSSVSRVLPGADSISIGRTIEGTQFYVLNPSLVPVPFGVPGELYIAGDGIAKGYFDNQVLTDERFMVNPFSSSGSSKMYKTGDLVRYRPDFELDYLGRIDFQVKIRGFRIEIGEIETVLGSYDAVKQCVVTTFDDGRGLALVAYIVLELDSEEASGEIKSFLSTKLPDYMVPAKLVSIEALPLTANGKVDRKALPAVDDLKTLSDPIEYKAPRNDFELSLCTCWQETLKCEQVGISDNFFELGGDSLMTVLLVHEMERATGIKYDIGDIFTYPTIEQLSAADISNEKKASSIVPIQRLGEGVPLFCLCGIHIYQEVADLFEGERPVYGVYVSEEQAFLEDVVRGEETKISVTDLAFSYYEAICRQQPEGPYQLAGISFGGLLAVETAKILQREGHKVELVVLFDTILPSAIERNVLNKTKRRIKKTLKLGKRYVTSVLKGATSLPVDMSVVREEAFIKAMMGFKSTGSRYSGTIVLAKARDNSAWGNGVSFREDYGWEEFVDGKFIVHEVEGDHLSIIRSPHAESLVDKIKPYFV
jgi:amino acid adenylation domain-containing protein